MINIPGKVENFIYGEIRFYPQDGNNGGEPGA
jgi:hypothetical protein